MSSAVFYGPAPKIDRMTAETRATEYSVVVRKRTDGVVGEEFVAEVLEFPDLHLYGYSDERVMNLARDAIATSIMLLSEEGIDIPEPGINREAHGMTGPLDDYF